MLCPCENQTAMPSIRPAAPIVMTIGFARQAPTAKPWTSSDRKPEKQRQQDCDEEIEPERVQEHHRGDRRRLAERE